MITKEHLPTDDAYTNADDNPQNQLFSNQNAVEATTAISMIKITVYVVLLLFIFVVALLCNCVVVTVFYRRPSLLNISNRFVLNLAMTNLLTTLVLIPFVIFPTLFGSWSLPPRCCVAMGVLTTVFFSSSIFTLLVISLDRYYAIIRPFHYSACMTSRRSGLLITLIWILSGLVASPPLIGLSSINYQPEKIMCTIDWRYNSIENTTYSWFLIVICFTLPYLIMLWVYISIFRTAQRTSARARRNSVASDINIKCDVTVTQQPRHSASSLSGITSSRRMSPVSALLHHAIRRRSSIVPAFHRDDWKAAKTSLIVMATFTFCWLPFFVVAAIETAVPYSSSQPDFLLRDMSVGTNTEMANNSEAVIVTDSAQTSQTVVVPGLIQGAVVILALASCAINPCVYVFRNQSVKHEIYKLLRRSLQCFTQSTNQSTCSSTKTRTSSCSGDRNGVSSRHNSLCISRKDSMSVPAPPIRSASVCIPISRCESGVPSRRDPVFIFPSKTVNKTSQKGTPYNSVSTSGDETPPAFEKPIIYVSECTENID